MAKDKIKDSKETKNSKESKEAESQPTKPGFDANAFIQETKGELDKVVWPSRQQLISESLSVVLMVTLSTTLIYLVDQFFNWAAGKVF